MSLFGGLVLLCFLVLLGCVFWCCVFFEGQRSGKLLANEPIRWRRDPGSSAHVELGAYYDTGDNLKVGFPMAFTTTMLSWSVLDFGGFIGSELSNTKMAIRWATDYLLKATAHPGSIYAQVENPNNDHKCWERPEDVAGETAAALAAASLVFRNSDPSYSKRLIHASMMVFDFADKHRGSYSDSLKSAVCPFYCSYSGYQDELLWGAAWLHKATKNAKYLSYMQANGGLLYTLPDVNLHYVTSASFILLTYAKYLSSSKHLVPCGQMTVTPLLIWLILLALRQTTLHQYYVQRMAQG